MSDPIIFSAPGNLMLLGEHAVLQGKLAVVCAIDRRVQATLTPRADRQVHIVSALGGHRTDLETLAPNQGLRFVMAAIRTYRDQLPAGFELHLASAFSHTIGFGSSAAITVATHAALRAWLGLSGDRHALFLAARATIREVQGVGSGADAAASVFGGVVGYRAEPLELFPLPLAHPLTAVYSGAKMPTVEVIARVEARRREQPELYAGLFALIEQTSAEGLAALRKDDWKRFGASMDVGQGLMDALGVNNEALARIVFALRQDAGIVGAKISGSGLGDCAVGLGRLQRALPVGETLPVAIDPAGVRREEVLA